MQPFECMGDRRHKNSPPPSEEEVDVTPDFRARAKERIGKNKRLNKISGAKEGEPNYLIDSQAALARAVSRMLDREVSEKHISNILGPVREGSKWDRVDRSTYVHAISRALGFEQTKTIPVPIARVEILSWLARLSDDGFEEFRVALEDARSAAKHS